MPSNSKTLNQEEIRRIVREALGGLTWEATLTDDSAPVFERDASKRILARSQKNIILALKALGVRFETEEIFDDTYVVGFGQAFPLRKKTLGPLWLAVERQFGFRPPKSLFVDVVLDLGGRTAVRVESVEQEADFQFVSEIVGPKK